jgi:hypothetical protein
MDPIQLALGGGGLLLNYFNKQDAMDTAAQNLAFQRQQAAKQERLSEATRTDSFGNSETYDPITNTWKTTLSPMQKAIQDAQQSEQYQSLTTDAQRNRSARKAAYDRSQAAQPFYNKAIAGFEYDQPATEAADRDKLGTLMAQANQDKNLGTRSVLATQAARTGNERTIPALYKASADKAGEDLSDTVLKSYLAAKQQRQGEVAAHNNQYIPQIQSLEGILQDNGSGAAVANPQTAAMLSAVQGQMASGGLNALTSGSSGINTASNALSNIMAKPIDLSFLKGSTGSNKTGTVTAKPTAEASGTVDAGNTWDADIPWTTAPDYLQNINWGF